MIKSAAGDCYWDVDLNDEYRLTFMARDADGSEKALFTFRTFEKDKFLSIAVMLGERQHIWGKWRALAEKHGAAALDQILDTATPQGPFPNVVDAKIAGHPANKRAVTVSVRLVPSRKVDLIRHTFQTSQLRKSFMGWAKEAGLGARLDLCLVGLLKGTKALAAKMDEYAQAELAYGLAVQDAMLTALQEGRDEAFIPPMQLPRR